MILLQSSAAAAEDHRGEVVMDEQMFAELAASLKEGMAFLKGRRKALARVQL